MPGPHPLNPPHREGDASRQAHVAPPAGSFERELGSEGFSGASTMMYHRNPPTAWARIDGPLRPRAFDLRQIAEARSPVDAMPILHNDHLRVRYWAFSRGTDHLFRNADGDELIFVHKGRGQLFCDYGHLVFEAGDYLVIPRGTMWRIETNEASEVLLIEATDGRYGLPERGLLGRHALFDPGRLDRPAIDDVFRAQDCSRPWRVVIKRRNTFTSVEYDYNPLDAIGWQGDLSVLRLNVKHVRSVTSHAYHLPPSAATTFVSERFVVCTLAPRLLETDPQAMKLPFWHNNDDYEEVIFNHRGALGSHPTIGEGMMTFHPSGLTHGPHPDVMPFMYELPVTQSNSYSVMIDARDALDASQEMNSREVSGYAESWRSGVDYAPDHARKSDQQLKRMAPQSGAAAP